MDQQETVIPDSENRKKPVVFFVLPCYEEEEGLRHTADVLLKKYRHLVAVESISQKSRILFVDDGSHDKTWSIIADLHKSDQSTFGGVKLAHNRGHQNALYAGLMVALRSGCDAAISMDADLQDDVDVVDDFISEYQNGNEIVYGVRSKRAKDTWFKRTSAEAFYKVFNWMGAETVYNHADYRLMGRASLQALSEYHEVNLFLRGIVPTLGFKTAKVYYERGEREAGESKYPLKKMISFAIQGITSFSTKPLSFVTACGVASILVGIGIFVYVLISLFSGKAMAGWGSLMCSIWLIGGFLMVCLGIVGNYVGKIYLEAKHRPRFYIEEQF
ncbi:glycosyltransferase [Bifidobacterium sp. ESL0682]|uniref:glycosyltransferase n=1 Tax=Bifidobacterium sp. ESL0682 TaxID=2983212 RepID=UPI0023F6DD45|nr:glycosyltransferase [Bifidobacterium sp. ESL0682]WEV41854.1 glycosyltransferase [Bifidobacterium sp. ESL0682]